MDFSKPITAFILKFIAAYIIFMIALPLLSVDKSIANGYRNMCNTLFGKTGKKGVVVFENKKNTKEKSHVINSDTEVRILNKDIAKAAIQKAQKQGNNQLEGVVLKFDISSWYFVVFPMILLWSLIIATPIKLKQKLINLLIGQLLIVLYILFKTWIFVLQKFNLNEHLTTAVLKGWLQDALFFVHQLTSHIGSSLFVAVFIWLLLCYHKISELNQYETSN